MNQLSSGYAVALVATAFFVSLALTRVMIVLGPKWGLMDEPDERRVHQTPVPRAGGIAIWVSFLAVVWSARLLFPDLFTGLREEQLLAFTLASAFLMIVGVIDDWRGMNALVKLGGQAVAGLLYFVLDSSLRDFAIFGFELPQAVSALVFVGWCILLINAFNLIDGLDGLCSGLVVVSLLVIAGFGLANDKQVDPVLVLAMAAAVAGFIRYNFNPAKIFLGDAGSMMLGFYLATSATQVGGERAAIGAIMLPIAIAGVPLLDVLLAIWRRSARNHLKKTKGEEVAGGVFAPDKDHLHHRFLELGLTQKRVALLLQGLAVILAALCFVPILVGGRGLVITVCGFLILGLIGLRHFARLELIHTGSILHLVVKRRQGRAIARLMHYLYDLGALTLAGFLAMTVETNFGTRDENGVWSVNFLILFIVVGVVSLQSLRIYRRVWSRPAMREFFLVAVALSVGALLTSSIWAASKNNVTWADFRCGLLGGQMAAWLVLGPRALPEMIRELAVDSKHRKLVKNCPDREQILIYGAGTRGTLFIEFLKNCAPEEFADFKVAGFLDENPKLRNRWLQGYRIHGGLACLEDLAGLYPISGVMVAITELPDEALRRLLEQASRLGLTVYQWSADQQPQKVGGAKDMDKSPELSGKEREVL